MRTKIIAALLAVLTALGGLNLFKSIKERLFPPATAQSTMFADAKSETDDGRTRVRVRVRANASEKVSERTRISVRDQSGTMIDRRFDVREGQTLVVDVEHADITVNTGNTDEAHVQITLDSSNMDRAREIFEEMNFRVNQVGDEVRIESDSRDGNWNSNWNGGLDIQIDVTIPERFNAQMKTTHGDVELADIDGLVELNTTHGDVDAGSLSGPSISLKSTHGDISVRRLESDVISLNTTHADIEVDTVVGKIFKAQTSHSDVLIEDLDAASEITTSHGDIEVRLREARTAALTTSHGDVVLYAPSTLNADLDLKAASVSISSGFSVRGDVKKDRVAGKLGSGGVHIAAHTTHGSVSLRGN